MVTVASGIEFVLRQALARNALVQNSLEPHAKTLHCLRGAIHVTSEA